MSPSKYVNKIVEGDSLQILKQIEDDTIDCIICDPPYAISFMQKKWDKAVVSIDIWKECLRVLKAGAFAFIMSSPRQDVLCKMILNLIDAGFETNFTSIYWTYASGFPKSASVSKLVDKRYKGSFIAEKIKYFIDKKQITIDFLASKLDKKDAKKTLWDWLHDGHNPIEKDWIEIKKILNITFEDEQKYEREIIAKKHRTTASQSNTSHEYGFGEKTNGWFNITKSATEQAKKLDGSYCGAQLKPAVEVILTVMKPLSAKSYVDQALKNGKGITWLDSCKTNSRFPANLIVSDNALNGHSKYFDLDAWSTAQFLTISKASASERNKGLENTNGKKVNDGRKTEIDNPFQRGETIRQNTHTTVKPLKLMSYLITMGSRENDIILDPFCGSGTTCIAAYQLHRNFIGIEKEQEYVDIANKRLEPYLKQTKLY